MSRVLVIDDELNWIETYEDWLEPEGYEVLSAQSIDEALKQAQAHEPHVILVDQKLEGPGGRDLGLSLIGRLAKQNPTSRILLVTAFATEKAVIEAFANGASDYLEKNAILEPLLHRKVALLAKDAIQAMGDASLSEREKELQDVWTRALTATDANRKGKALEDTVKHLFTLIPGMHHARTNARNQTEEIDVIVTNRSNDAFLQRQGDFIIVECKNWSTSVGTPVSARLRDKVTKRYGRSKLGICVSMGGFADTVKTDLLSDRREDTLILLVDKDGLQSWIDADDRAGWLISKIEASVV